MDTITPTRVRAVAITGTVLALLQIASLGCSQKAPKPSGPDPGDRGSTSVPASKGDPVSTVRVPEQDFEISLSGEGWTLDKRPAPKAANYFRLRPTMMVGILPPRQAETEKAHEENSKRFKDLRKPSATKELVFEPGGANHHGHPLWMFITEESHPGRTVFVGSSITWLNKKKSVVMIFEGHYSSEQPAEMERERSLFRSTADKALRSVR
jgi:hypothetical protein